MFNILFNISVPIILYFILVFAVKYFIIDEVYRKNVCNFNKDKKKFFRYIFFLIFSDHYTSKKFKKSIEEECDDKEKRKSDKGSLIRKFNKYNLYITILIFITLLLQEQTNFFILVFSKFKFFSYCIYIIKYIILIRVISRACEIIVDFYKDVTEKKLIRLVT